MKKFRFLIVLIVSIILSSKNESEACVWNNWFCDWISGRNNNRETTTTSITEEKMQAIRNISSSINQFSFELHKAMAKKTNGSFISSPLSAAMVLMMAAYGARGENANRMNSLLHFDTKNNTYKTGINSLIEMFDALNPIGFKIGNKIYAGKNTKIESDFINLVSKTFKSSFENVDFGLSENTTTKINDWRAEKNHQRLTNDIKPDEISADTELFLINSLYFSALWEVAFNETHTKLIKTNISKEETIEQLVMREKVPSYYSYTYHPEFDFSALTFEFKRDSNNDELIKFTMLYHLDNRTNVDDIGRNLHTIQLSDLYDEKKKVESRVPKFRIESTINLEDILNLLGTNFSGISKQGSELKMNKIVQKLTLEIDELGIEAAIHSEASFANKTGSSGPTLKQVPIFLDLPFIFLITYNNTILFTGRVTNGH